MKKWTVVAILMAVGAILFAVGMTIGTHDPQQRDVLIKTMPGMKDPPETPSPPGSPAQK
jgi:hypothetical protein